MPDHRVAHQVPWSPAPDVQAALDRSATAPGPTQEGAPHLESGPLGQGWASATCLACV